MATSLPPGAEGARSDTEAQVYGWPEEVSIIHKTCYRIDLAKEAGWHADHFISLPQSQITVVVASQGPTVTTDITATHLRRTLRQRSQNAQTMFPMTGAQVMLFMPKWPGSG